MLINYIINVHILKPSKFFLVFSIFKYNTSNSFKINLRRSKALDFIYFSYNKKMNTLYLKFIKEKYITSGAYH